MIAGQRLVDSTNHCVALFPMPYLYVTQNEHDLYSIDFSGWGPNGKVYNAPIYAPFDGKITYKQSGQNTIVFESTSDVRCADGGLHHVRVMLAHADNQPYNVGATFRMGDLLYHTGTAPPATGDHLHMEVGIGTSSTIWDPTYSHLNNPTHMYDVLYVNDTILQNPSIYNWKTWSGPTPPPPTPSREKFPWVLYARKLREGRWEI